MIRFICRLFRPRHVIQTRAAHKAMLDAQAKRRDLHNKLARELGRPAPFRREVGL